LKNSEEASLLLGQDLHGGKGRRGLPMQHLGVKGKGYEQRTRPRSTQWRKKKGAPKKKKVLAPPRLTSGESAVPAGSGPRGVELGNSSKNLFRRAETNLGVRFDRTGGRTGTVFLSTKSSKPDRTRPPRGNADIGQDHVRHLGRVRRRPKPGRGSSPLRTWGKKLRQTATKLLSVVLPKKPTQHPPPPPTPPPTWVSLKTSSNMFLSSVPRGQRREPPPRTSSPKRNSDGKFRSQEELTHFRGDRLLVAWEYQGWRPP